MPKKIDGPHQRPDTRFSKDGRAVFVRLRVDRREYEFARGWAMYHAGADPAGTAEEQLEGYLSTALTSHMDQIGWKEPPEIAALYPPPKPRPLPDPADDDDDDDGIPF